MFREVMKEKWTWWGFGGAILIIFMLLLTPATGSEGRDEVEEESPYEPYDIVIPVDRKIEIAIEKITGRSNYELIDKGITSRIDDKGTEHDDEKLVNLRIKRDEFDRDGALTDTKELLQSLSEIPEVYDVCLIWEAEGINKYGNKEQSYINKIIVKNDTFKTATWSKVIPSDIPDIADDYHERPQFRK